MINQADNKILEKWLGWHRKSGTVFTPSYDGRGAGFAPAFGAFNNATFDVGQTWKTSLGTKRVILGIVGDTFLFESGGKIYEQDRSGFQNDTSKIDQIAINTAGIGWAMEVMVTSAIIVMICAPAVLASLPAASIAQGTLTVTTSHSFSWWVVTAVPAIQKSIPIIQAALRARALMIKTTPTLYDALINRAIFDGIKTIPASVKTEVTNAITHADKGWLEIAGLPKIPEIKDGMTWDEYISTTKDCVDTAKDYYEIASAIYSTWTSGGTFNLLKLAGKKFLEGLLAPLKEWQDTLKDSGKSGAQNAMSTAGTNALKLGVSFSPMSPREVVDAFKAAGFEISGFTAEKIAGELKDPKAAAAVCAALTLLMQAAEIDMGDISVKPKPGAWVRVRYVEPPKKPARKAR